MPFPDLELTLHLFNLLPICMIPMITMYQPPAIVNKLVMSTNYSN